MFPGFLSKHKKKVQSVLVEFLSLIQGEESGRGAEEEQELAVVSLCQKEDCSSPVDSTMIV